MSTLQLTDCNLFARQIDWVNELGLGSKAYAKNEARTSNTIGPLPANLFVELVAGLAAADATGSFNIKVSFAQTPNFTSPDLSLTLTGSGSNQNQEANGALSDSKRFLTIKVTEGGVTGGSTLNVNSLTVRDLMQKVNGVFQGYHEAVGGFNKVNVDGTANYSPMNINSQ